MSRALPPVAALIRDGGSVSSSWCGMTDACRRWLAREVKAGRVYRRRGLREGFRPFGNTTYWTSANRAADLEAQCAAAARKLMMAASLDEMVRGRVSSALRLLEAA